MFSISDTMSALISARQKKILAMSGDFEPTQRIKRYKEESLDTIRSTYRDLMKKTAQELERVQGEMRAKYDRKPLDADERSRQIIRCAALDNKSLERQAKAIIDSELPVHSETAFILGKELRVRGNSDEADRLVFHATSYLEQPWTHDPEYQRIEQMKGRCETFEKGADEMLVLALEPKEGDVLHIDGLEIKAGRVPGKV